jgi:YaiO family outer membrane protein
MSSLRITLALIGYAAFTSLWAAPALSDPSAPNTPAQSPPAAPIKQDASHDSYLEKGILTVSNQFSTLSSPGNLYGPWNVAKLQYQWSNHNDVPSITLVNRTDNDRLSPSHSNGVILDDYHTWSDDFYTYAQVGFANGDTLPTRAAYLEGDLKVTPNRSLIAALGGSVLANPDGTTTRYLSVGPTWYSNSPMIYTVRFLPANTDGVSTSATELVAEYNKLGHDQITLTYLSGSQPSILAGAPPSLAVIQRLNETDIIWNHWLNKRFGFILGGTLGDHYDRATGASLYQQHGIWLGLFAGRAIGLPK